MIILPATHEEWLQERKYGIGASDAASILGMSKWKSNQQLWEEKVGIREPEDISDKPYVQYGHDAEPYIRGLFALNHPELEVSYESPYKIIRHDVHKFIFCTPDGELREIQTDRRGGLEIKTTEIRNPSQWDQWNGRIPDQYYCQVVWQMIATGWEFVWLTALIKWYTKDGDLRMDLREYHIERDEALDEIKHTKSQGIAFWKAVETKQKPALKLPLI